MRSAQRAEALRLSEVDLEEDAQRFDKFLKESDAGVQEAMRKADVESRARQDKVSHVARQMYDRLQLYLQQSMVSTAEVVMHQVAAT